MLFPLPLFIAIIPPEAEELLFMIGGPFAPLEFEVLDEAIIIEFLWLLSVVDDVCIIEPSLEPNGSNAGGGCVVPMEADGLLVADCIIMAGCELLLLLLLLNGSPLKNGSLVLLLLGAGGATAAGAGAGDEESNAPKSNRFTAGAGAGCGAAAGGTATATGAGTTGCLCFFGTYPFLEEGRGGVG